MVSMSDIFGAGAHEGFLAAGQKTCWGEEQTEEWDDASLGMEMRQRLETRYLSQAWLSRKAQTSPRANQTPKPPAG